MSDVYFNSFDLAAVYGSFAPEYSLRIILISFLISNIALDNTFQSWFKTHEKKTPEFQRVCYYNVTTAMLKMEMKVTA